MKVKHKGKIKFKYKYGPSWSERLSTWLSKRALKKAIEKSSGLEPHFSTEYPKKEKK